MKSGHYIVTADMPVEMTGRDIAVQMSGRTAGWLFVKHADGGHWTSAAKLTPETFGMLQAHRADDQHPAGFIKPDSKEQVFFYEQDYYVLSNFAAFTLQWRGKRFDTSESAYHYEKFFGAPDIQHAITQAPSAHEAFKLAEHFKTQRREDWEGVKVATMYAILHAKAAQHEYVRKKLLATGDRELIEDSWRDSYWGWGPNRNGHNKLGWLWMQVRADIRAGLTDMPPLPPPPTE